MALESILLNFDLALLLLLLLSHFSHVRLLRPHRWQPTRLPHLWDSPGKNTGVGCHFLLQCMKVKSESEVAQSCPTLATPWTVAHQAPPSMGFSRQKYWSGVPLQSILIQQYLNILPLKNSDLVIFSKWGTKMNIIWAKIIVVKSFQGILLPTLIEMFHLLKSTELFQNTSLWDSG